MWKNGEKRELVVFSTLVIAGYLLIELHLFKVHVVSPNKIITSLVRAVVH